MEVTAHTNVPPEHTHRGAPAVASAAAGAARGRSGRLVRASGSLLLGLMLLLVAALAVGPRTGHYRTLAILSGSMEPTFAPGDLVVSTPMRAREVRRGDVITFHAPVEGAPLVTHRVVRVVEHGPHPVVRTRGDANPTADPWSARIDDDVVWRQRAVVPRAGRVIHELRRPAVHRVLLYGSLAALVVVGLRVIWSEPKRAGD